jgi:hypothetical protein
MQRDESVIGKTYAESKEISSSIKKKEGKIKKLMDLLLAASKQDPSSEKE